MPLNDMPSATTATHVVVLVNGLWGWQRDWSNMKKSLEAQNDGSYLIHVSAVNVGAQTYAGIDVCGHRLAHEITHLVTLYPGLTHISLVGHSMGGLIARFAIGLLADPLSCTIAGLQPCSYISIATPHLGCSSSLPAEAEWHDRPYMCWLAAAVAAGHLGGHQHLGVHQHLGQQQQQQQQKQKQKQAAHATLTATVACGAACATSQVNCSCSGGDGHLHGVRSEDGCQVAVNTHDVRGVDGCEGTREPHCLQDPPVRYHSTKAPHARADTKGNSRGRSSRSWPWSPCRSVVQLLGCDAWRPTLDSVILTTSSSSNSHSHSCACHRSMDSSTQCGSSSSTQSIRQVVAAAHPCSSCLVGRGPVSSSSGRGSSGNSSRHGSNGSSSGRHGESEGCSSREAALVAPLLDVLCQDVCIICASCGCMAADVRCFTGLRLFQHRAVYSSAGGDHLIPWTSSSLLQPSQLPRTTSRTATAAAQSKHQHCQLPVPGLWVTKPVIIEQCVQKQQQTCMQEQCTEQQQQQQEQQQQQQHPPRGGPDGPSGPGNPSGPDSTAGPGGGCGPGVLGSRLIKLQMLPWRRFHVVWPRVCLGSSHCNIQFNGPLNFVGRAVVQHVCDLLMGNVPATRACDGC